MAESEGKKPVPPPPPEVPLKFYISQCSTYMGKVLLKELATPTTPVPGPSVTAKVAHTFFTSDSTIDPNLQSSIAGIWKVNPSFHSDRKSQASITVRS